MLCVHIYYDFFEKGNQCLMTQSYSSRRSQRSKEEVDAAAPDTSAEDAARAEEEVRPNLNFTN